MAKTNGQIAAPKGYQLGKRLGGGGGNFITPDDGTKAKPASMGFVFEQWVEDNRGKDRAQVMLLATGEVGILPDWGLLKHSFGLAREGKGPKKGDAFMLVTKGREKIKKGKWKGKPAVNLDLIPLVKR